MKKLCLIFIILELLTVAYLIKPDKINMASDELKLLGTESLSLLEAPIPEPIVVEEPKEEPKEEVKEEPKVEEQPVYQPVYVDNSGVTVPVLNYHFFYDANVGGCGETICLATWKFEQQLQYLVDNGFKTLTMQEFVDWYNGNLEIPEKSVLLTIDDGAMGTSFINGNYLIPLLEKYQVHATLFLITAWWDKANYQSEYLDVESHGYDIHFSGACGTFQLGCLDYEGMVNDFQRSFDILGSNLSFCYPFYYHNSTSDQALRDMGVQVAFGGGSYNASRNSYRYYIPRYPIYDSITLDQFIYMVN